jgi:hypothetical protein
VYEFDCTSTDDDGLAACSDAGAAAAAGLLRSIIMVGNPKAKGVDVYCLLFIVLSAPSQLGDGGRVWKVVWK